MNSASRVDSGFAGLGLSPRMLARLDRLGFTTPTPIQEAAIPIGLRGRDLVGIAQTGTGKTLAFGLPMIERLAGSSKVGLVVVPTRELALQVDETLAAVGGPFGLRTVVLIGGASMARQVQQLRARPRAIIATPGRLLDHLGQGTLSLGNVGIAVLDEADRMLDMGFAPAINRLMAQVPAERQTMLFSATMPEEITRLATRYLNDPERVETAPQGTLVEGVTHELFVVDKPDKPELLDRLLAKHKGKVLVFSRTKHGARKLTRSVSQMGHTTAELHANRSLAQRRSALDGFKAGKFRVLVATDIAARGIDVQAIELVINYDLPDSPDDYLHRVGRTGRAGATGHAITFATPEQGKEVRDIEKLLRTTLPLSPDSALDLPRPQAPTPRGPARQLAQPQHTQAEQRPANGRGADSLAPRQAVVHRTERPAPRQKDVSTVEAPARSRQDRPAHNGHRRSPSWAGRSR
jgi:ATP-dependent RNA helicase RhlE